MNVSVYFRGTSVRKSNGMQPGLTAVGRYSPVVVQCTPRVRPFGGGKWRAINRIGRPYPGIFGTQVAAVEACCLGLEQDGWTTDRNEAVAQAIADATHREQRRRRQAARSSTIC